MSARVNEVVESDPFSLAFLVPFVAFATPMQQFHAFTLNVAVVLFACVPLAFLLRIDSVSPVLRRSSTPFLVAAAVDS
jgi:uncharacterized membrane protein